MVIFQFSIVVERTRRAQLMSRMTLCGLTAAALTLLSVGLMIARYNVMGDEVELPAGPNVWKVTLIAHGQAEAGARLWIGAAHQGPRTPVGPPSPSWRGRRAYARRQKG